MDLPIRKPSRWQNRVRPMWCLIDRIISFRPEISTGIASAPSKTCSWILLTSCLLATSLRAQQPVEPVAPTPINGETYYLVDQVSNLQADANSGSTAGSVVTQNTRSFTSLTQRWAFTLAPSGNWKVSNLFTGLCMDTQQTATPAATIQQPCALSTASQEWIFTYTTNGYYTVKNATTGLLLDVAGSSATAGTDLVQTALSTNPTQSQLWLFRPAFLRGVDNALLAKQEADRLVASAATPFFNDAGQMEDDLLILKNHGVNMIRLRPTPLVVPGTSTPLYDTYTLGSSTAIPATCTGNGCSAETDAADITFAQRAKNLGMSIELTLFFDGASSTAAPAAWNGYSASQVSAAISAYVKAQIEEYRAAGVMPDIVSIGNEVNTGFLGTGVASSASGSPSGAYNSAAFSNFAAYQIAGIQAVQAAAADTTIGPALPPPLTCIHTTPAWLINSFYPEATQANIPYDMVCESYYPIYHGPLTAAQAAQPTTGTGCTSPTSSEPEQMNLANGVTAVGKPILLIEIAEHYETGFDPSDCFYANNRAGQRQFALDIQSTMKSLGSNLGAGMTWWDATGTNVPAAGEGYANYNEAGYPADLFYWDGLTLFDDADNGDYTDVFTAPTYNTVLPALAAVGGKLDPTLGYKFVNASDGRILETAASLTTSGAALDTGANNEIMSQNQEWQITGDGNGYFQIASLNPATPANVLDTQGLTTPGTPVVQVAAAANTTSQEWDIVTAGNGYYTITNSASSLVLATAPASRGGTDLIEEEKASSSNVDWITPASMNQMWQIIPVHIVASSSPAALAFDPAPPSSVNSGDNPGTVTVEIENAAGVLTGSTSPSITLALTGPSGFSQTQTLTGVAGIASFDLRSTVLSVAGTYSISVTSPGLTGATAAFTVTAPAPTATTTVLSSPATSVIGISVTLSATVTGTAGTPTPTGQVAFLDGSTTLGNGTLSSSDVATFTTSSLAVGSHNLTANYAGDANNAPSSSQIVTLTVTGSPDFSIALAPASATIAAGNSASSTVSITPVNGFAAAATLSCSGLPSFASCTFSPASVSPNGGAVTSTVTVTTNVQTAGIQHEDRPSGAGGGIGSGSSLAILLLPLVAFHSKRRTSWCRVVGSMFVALLLLQGALGCGGSSDSSTTPQGQYSVSITATSGALSHSTALTLAVK
jgi:arabinogalactan endo-1,4-beta-galactosidase